MAVKNIDQKHPLYVEFEESWKVMRDCAAGEDDVKDAGERYLPMKSATKAMKDLALQSASYLAYRDRAEFPELVSPTIRGSAGLICDKELAVELPTQMEYLLEDCTGDGTTLAQFHRRLVTEQLTTGRYGILPGLRTNGEPGQFCLTGYTAERIINWDKDDSGVVDYVVLDESEQARNKESNVWSRQEKYLECQLDEAGNYVAIRYLGKEPLEPEAALKPDLQGLKKVPFVFADTSDLTAEPDDVPMYGLAKLSLRIYRLDADYVQGLHMTSEPTPYVTGFTDPADAIKQGQVPTTIGASVLWILPENATAGFLEFSGPGLAAQATAITNALERAAMYGAQLFSDQSKTAESGESRKLRMRGQRSLLRNIASVAAAAIEKALRNIAEWAGLDPDKVVVKPNLEFEDYTPTAQEITALVQGWQSGAYSKKTLFENLQRASMIPAERKFEEEQELIDDESPVLGNIRDPAADAGA